ncbi:MAG TPA: hypothetical protein VKP13_17025 [Nitrospira sp.]|nr:hypothetical protein [Nitrospira sp.]
MKHALGLLGLILLLVRPSPSAAVPMVDDPKGFENISWGSPLHSRTDLKITRESDHVSEYQFKEAAPSFAGIPVESVRLSAVNEQFARVTIRYQGEKTHRQIMLHLEHHYGPIERLPGQMMRGLNQQYNWRGSDSEINLTYQANTERGFIFFDSRTLAPRFNDQLTDSAE